jgi:hypothetical protein
VVRQSWWEGQSEGSHGDGAGGHRQEGSRREVVEVEEAPNLIEYEREEHMADDKKPKSPKSAVIHIPAPNTTSTGGMPHKQHKDRNVSRPKQRGK